MNHSSSPVFIATMSENLEISPDFIQVVLGPRQVGKTTGILEFLKGQKLPNLYYSADEKLFPSAVWIEDKWQEAVLLGQECILALDEIQKIPHWSSVVKNLWDRQKRNDGPRIRLILLGSSSLQIHEGLKESLAGRFQLIRAHHWNLNISRELHKFTIEDFSRYGGYPGSYKLLTNTLSWETYIQESIIETVIGKDILQIARVSNPALFRQAFSILMSFPAQEISYTKLLGQLQDRGNTDLIKHYIELYEGAFLIKALQKFSGKTLVTRASSPKLVPLCGALIGRELFQTREGRGRAIEAMVGATLINAGLTVQYWREGNAEVDYVTTHVGCLFAIEVKSGRSRSTKGMAEFTSKYKKARPVYLSETTLERFVSDPRGFLELLK